MVAEVLAMNIKVSRRLAGRGGRSFTRVESAQLSIAAVLAYMVRTTGRGSDEVPFSPRTSVSSQLLVGLTGQGVAPLRQ